jgi:DNA-binding response OmpR family regulator
MKKVLLVEDEKELHPVVLSFFPKEEFKVLCASDGLEGIQKCRNEDFDLVILDYRIPKLDGIKFFLQLRDMQETRKVELTPVIFISGDIDEVRSKISKPEKCDFLSKPFTKEELFSKINKPASKASTKFTLLPGEKLFSEGDTGDCMYYVVSGLLETAKSKAGGHLQVIGKVGPGELIGEMAVLTKDPRVLTATAIEKTELIPIPSEKVMSIVDGQPKWIKLMIENLSRRLKDSIRQIS